MKITIVTGGSGGHIFPALTFADGYQGSADISFIGNSRKMESWIVPQHNYPFYGINNQGLQGSIIDKFKAVIGQFKAISQAKAHLKQIQPDVVIAFGGYVSLPVILAASKLKIKVIIHEQNAFPGKANKMGAKHASAIITCYEEAFKGEKNVHFLGNPRSSLIHESISHTEEYQRLGLSDHIPLVLMVMGSQGSSSMNDKFVEYANAFHHDDYQVVIVSGPLNFEGFKERITNSHPNLKITGFVDQKALLEKIDLIVCRSGASTIAEIQSFGIASLLIPSPHVANNHQYYNAKSLEDHGACELLVEEGLNGKILDAHVDSLMHDALRRHNLSENVKLMAKPSAVKDIMRLVEEVVND